jgi:hypothetical protein
MLFKDYGFRPVYHNVCAFTLNDKLRERIQACPDVDKASHAVCYGYIDAKKGLMLEVLCAGKQATKYFYFKDVYEGERITIPASELKKVEFEVFETLEPRFRKKFEPRIASLKKYDAPQEVEETRGEELDFLDGFRDLQHPDVVRVIARKDGLQDEEIAVRMVGTGDHCLLGTVEKKPKQDFGLSKGDTAQFYVRKIDDEKIELWTNLDEENESHKLTQEDLDDGSFLKYRIVQFQKDTENRDAFELLLTVLRSSSVAVPCDVQLSDEAAAILEKLKKEGKNSNELEGSDAETFRSGVRFAPRILESSGHKFFPAFTDEAEIKEDVIQDAECVRMPVLHAIDMASDPDMGLDGIVVNAFTDNFIVKKELFEAICRRDPLLKPEEEQEKTETKESTGTESFTNRENLRLAVLVGKMGTFNYALYRNKVNPIQDLRIWNGTGDPVSNLTLRIYSDFEFFKPYEIVLPSIPSGKPISLPDPKLHINIDTLSAMTEAVTTTVTAELIQNGEVLCGARGRMQVMAYDQWMGGTGYRYLLPAFVIPTHPVIPALMHDTAERLAKWGKQSSLEGYQSHDPNRVRDLAAAAYAAVQKKNIVYAEPPVSFFTATGQKIRTPEAIMEQRLGTCMDMTLLYAALLEGIGLHPMLVLIQGHIFAGVWLKQRSPEELKNCNVVIDNLEQLTMRINNGADELTFVECTAMCAGKQSSFEEAEAYAKHNLDPSTFETAIDVFLSRLCGINPIPPRVKEGSSYQIELSEKDDNEVTEAPASLGLSSFESTEIKAKKITNKRELWESKLLDLSTHNMLLNLPLNASVEPIMSSHIDELEDALADGHEFHLLPVAEWIAGLSYSKADENGQQSKPIPWLQEALSQHGIFEMTSWPVSSNFDFNEKFRQEFRNHRLYTYCTPKQLERELTTIYRAARASQQENGVSSLYLAIGLLRWFAEPDSEVPCYAPLILVPIEIVRKSANQGYALHIRQDEPHFNSTLLEMLKQNFNLTIGGLEPLPADEHGIDIKRAFAVVRNALFTLKNWDVVESCVIGNFSFAQFAMWNDIHTAGDMLEKSDVVRSLIKGHVDWDVSLPENLDDEQTYLPITVDATQLQAIKMAAHGTTFVLHGPPGTGKSQTITGMIANLMAQGKKVLFVAEKMAALSVVQRRLTSLGIGDFCLELHSDKANKKQVLAQLDKALAIKHPSNRTEYEEYFKKTAVSRAKLDGYAKRLHTAHTCGYSLRELIDLFETVRDVEQPIEFDRHEAGKLSKEQIRSHTYLIGRLIAAGEAVGNIASHPLMSVGLASYSSEVRDSLREYTDAYLSALESVQEKGKAAANILGIETPRTKAELFAVRNLIDAYNYGKNTDTALLSVLNCDSSISYDFYDLRDAVSNKAAALRSIWKPEFLTMDMSVFLAKHEAAGKKFFGKASAMAAVTNEVQQYALTGISYEQIPALLQKVAQYQKDSQKVKDAYNALPDTNRQLINMYAGKKEYAAAIVSANDCKAKAESFPGGLDAILNLAAKPETDSIFSEFTDALLTTTSAEEQLDMLLCRKKSEGDCRIGAEMEFGRYLSKNASELKDWSLYNQVRQECVESGLAPVIKAYEHGVAADKLERAYKKGLYYALICNIINSDDVLSSFSGATFNEAIQQFKRLDDQLLQQAKQEIYYLLASHVPSSWDSPEVGMELNLLRKAIGSNARGMSIRTLFERIPHVLQTLCPCMLMSPNSVAQYLAQDNNLFDVVIFDEASQLPTCKAIGALSRAKNAVIVGDPKQMPPTSFFAGSGPEVDDLALDDLDSILDDALALGIPSQHLQWHYRSTHESLIAFSNNQFYDNKMYTFPSANDLERHVTAVHVDGLYSKSTNVKEAEAVVEEIIRRFMVPELKKQSIGVVTFNVKQQTLIENLLAKQFQSNPELDVWANNGEDPLFVKNLENVQGDERDVILFSIGYGPDEKGYISMNFGPINKPGGGKRLNVAFSRARVTMTIFASLYSNDIKVTETSPEGLVAFRNFLKFAEGQDIQTASASEEKEKLAKAGIMQSICSAITEHGYRCETMVGHSNFRIDIAVIDPFIPTKYIMGILLDGDNYRRTKNTRDREVAQTGVLNNLGWTLMRIWTIDWWDNRDKVIQKILRQLDTLKAVSERKAEEAAADEEKRQAEETAREAQTAKIKEELQAQAEEVAAEDAEAEKNHRLSDIPVVEPKPVVQPQPVSEEKPQVEAEAGNSLLEMLLHKVADANGLIVDKRNNGGALWIIGGKTLEPIMKEFESLGICFAYKAGGGRATGGKDGWWAKTDVVLPSISEEHPLNDQTKTESATKGNSDTLTASPEEGKMPDPDNSPHDPDREEVPTGETLPERETLTGNQDVKKEAAPTEYVEATLPVTDMSQAEFASSSNKKEIQNRMLTILEAEAPILKDVLFRRVWASFRIQKTTSAIDAAEKALKSARIKTTKQKGVIFCWKPDQDPKAYLGIRISNARAGDEICQQEIKNAAVYVLKHKGTLSKDDLVKEISLLLGYKRLGKNLETALLAGIQYAKTSGIILISRDGTCEIPSVPGDEVQTEKISGETVAPADPEVKTPTDTPPININVAVPDGDAVLYCEGSDYKAVAVQHGTEFVVLRGSKISSTLTASCPDSVIRMREKYSDTIDNDFMLISDISFVSPSGAAGFVAGASRNGYTEWHTENGTTLKYLK